jgi:hypothetical protein
MIRDRPEELRAFYAQRFAEPVGDPPASTNGHRSEFTDEEVIKLAGSAKNAAKFQALWSGDILGYPSQSEADQALVSLLAFYTQDEEQLDRLYRRSGLCRQKWLDRPDYRHRTVSRALSNLRETYAPDDGARMVVGGNGNLASQRPNLYSVGTLGHRKPEVIRLAEVEPPGPRRYLCQDLVLAAYVTLLHGDGGVAKSLLALALAVAVAGSSSEWLGRRVENGRVLYLDFELDAEEQARRVHQLCRGMGLEKPPEDLLYMSAAGHTTREAFEAARAACEQHGVELLIVDSYGVALHGDAEAARDVIGFHQKFLEPLRALGVAVLVIDHQSRLQAGQSYQQKGAFGSVYKANLARSVIQVEATERGEGTLTVRLRQKKHNFGPLVEPFEAKLNFSEEMVTLEAVELAAAELVDEGTLNAKERIKLALRDGPKFPADLATATGLALKTVKNRLGELRRAGLVKPTGRVEDQAEQVSLVSPPLYRDGDRDTTSEEDDGQGDQGYHDLQDEPLDEEAPWYMHPLACECQECEKYG